MQKKARTHLRLEDRISYRFALIATRIGTFLAPMYASRYRLTLAAWRVLAVIGRFEPLSAKEVAERTSTDPFKVTRALDVLVRKKLISRQVDPSDRRRASLRLTAGGRAVHDEIEQVVIRVERALLSTLDAAERETLTRVLGKIDEQVAARLLRGSWENFSRD